MAILSVRSLESRLDKIQTQLQQKGIEDDQDKREELIAKIKVDIAHARNVLEKLKPYDDRPIRGTKEEVQAKIERMEELNRRVEQLVEESERRNKTVEWTRREWFG